MIASASGGPAACSIASRSRIALARAVAHSFREHHPALPFFVLLADEPHEGIPGSSEPFQVVPFQALEIPDSAAFRFRYEELELSYACTPFLIRHLLLRGFDSVLFLKQETLVLDRLDPLLAMLRRHPVILTPHLLEPATGTDALARELRVLRAGVFNGGVVGFSRCEEALAILQWWQRKVERECLRDVENGLHYEQRWLDLVPSLVPACGIVRDPGVNIGHWNLVERPIVRVSGSYRTRGHRVRIVRFSGYDPARPEMVSRYNLTLRVSDTGDASSIFHRYHRLLLEFAWEETSRLPYAWDFFHNGVPIRVEMRRLYRGFPDAGRRWADPFRTTGQGTFYGWLRACRPELFEEAGRG